METEFWRVDNGRLRWWTVDLPAVVDLRRELLPPAERATRFACDPFDLAWADAVGEAGPNVLILARSLFMFRTEDTVRTLVSALAERFLADAWYSTRSRPGPRWTTVTGCTAAT